MWFYNWSILLLALLFPTGILASPLATVEQGMLLDIAHLFGIPETSYSPTSKTDLAPTILTRGGRSASTSYEFGHLLPLLQGVLQSLPPPAPSAPRQDNIDDASSTTSPLAQLIPFLVNGIIGLHGSFSSISLPSIESPESIEAKKAAATTAVPEPEFAKGAPEPAPVRMLDSTAASPLIQTKIHITKGKSQVSYDLKNTVDPNLNCTGPRNRSAVCNDLPIDRILSLMHALVVTKDRNVYRVRANGEPIDMEPTILDKRIDDITATASVEGMHFVFQGDKYTKYDKNFTPAAGNYPRLITQGFPGVLTPVDGAFQLNNHTWVFVSGTKYVYFQPRANPNVDPRFSPQYLESVPGAPPTIDSAFTVKNRRFLHKGGTIYELAPEQMKVEREIPVFSSIKPGWLKCPDLFPVECVTYDAPNLVTELPVLAVPELNETTTTLSPETPNL